MPLLDALAVATVPRVAARRRPARRSPRQASRSPRFASTGPRSTAAARTICRSSTPCSSTPTRRAAGAASCCATSATPRRARRASGCDNCLGTRVDVEQGGAPSHARRRPGETSRGAAPTSDADRVAAAEDAPTLTGADEALLARLRDLRRTISQERAGAGVRRLSRPHARRDGRAPAHEPECAGRRSAAWDR